jgi:endonuclease/exonuclease/phosphatase family metal-dependent hydrolase
MRMIPSFSSIPSSAILLMAFVAACGPPVSEEHREVMTGNKADSVRHAGITAPVDFQYPSHDSLTVLTWNVEHFVDRYDNPYIGAGRENKAEPNPRASKLVEALLAIDADLVVLQEFESVAYLENLAKGKLRDAGYQFFAGAESYDWYQNVVLMSKLPLGVVYSYGSAYTPYRSEEGRRETQRKINTRLWSVDVLARPDYSFVLTGVHLKAGGGSRNASMRQGQMSLLHGQLARFLKEDVNVNMLAVGDFNASPESDEMEYFLHGDEQVVFNDPTATGEMPTHPAESPRRQLDYILPNTYMHPELREGSVGVPTQRLDQTQMAAISDHLPVWAAFYAREM